MVSVDTLIQVKRGGGLGKGHNYWRQWFQRGQHSSHNEVGGQQQGAERRVCHPFHLHRGYNILAALAQAWDRGDVLPPDASSMSDYGIYAYTSSNITHMLNVGL